MNEISSVTIRYDRNITQIVAAVLLAGYNFLIFNVM